MLICKPSVNMLFNMLLCCQNDSILHMLMLVLVHVLINTYFNILIILVNYYTKTSMLTAVDNASFKQHEMFLRSVHSTMSYEVTSWSPYQIHHCINSSTASEQFVLYDHGCFWSCLHVACCYLFTGLYRANLMQEFWSRHKALAFSPLQDKFGEV